MKWRSRQGSSNIEDRRGGRRRSSIRRTGRGGAGLRLPGGRATGGGIGGLVVIGFVVIAALALGVNPLSLLEGNVSPGGNSGRYSAPRQSVGDDELTQFVGVVIKETENLWGEVFADNGLNYEAPVVVLFSGRSPSGCGMADAATGPFYCPSDQKVYIDLSFYEQLRRQFGAGGDFAQAYVLAHEIGHHVQNLTGVLPEFNRLRGSLSAADANAYSVKVELQADCYAGVWAAYVGQQGLLEAGDIEEALNAASKIGDDTLQKRSQGIAVPDSFTHGSSAQRVKWFKIGQENADVGLCDTFAVS